MRRSSRVLVACVAGLALAAGGVVAVPTSQAAEGCNADARTHLTTLAAAARPYGTAAERSAATYITGQLTNCHYTVTSQPFKAGGKKTSANVIAVREVPSATAEIIVGAHYDSATTAKGADDNASGVAAMLAFAARIDKGEVQPLYTVKFVAFGAEETGTMYGSYEFVKKYVSGGKDFDTGLPIAAMVNLDALAAGDIAYVHGNDENAAGQALIDWASALVEDQRLGLDYNGNGSFDEGELANTSIHESGLWDDSDYFWFYDRGIPFLYLEATNWKAGAGDGFTQVARIDGRTYGKKGAIYHTSYDTVAYIDTIPEFNGGGTAVKRIDTRMAGFGSLLDAFVTAPDIPVPGATAPAN